jgi:signal transduction histidine kinase
VEVAQDLKVAPHIEPMLYRVAQEALRNVVAHAEADNVSVTLWERTGRVGLVVEDDGKGFVAGPAVGAERRRHFGLRILHDLTEDAGGELRVDSTPGEGTTVRVEIPT